MAGLATIGLTLSLKLEEEELGFKWYNVSSCIYFIILCILELITV